MKTLAKITEMRKGGSSFRQIAEATGLTESMVRVKAIEAGVHTPVTRQGEKIRCIDCSKKLPRSEFADYYLKHSKYLCKSCNTERTHVYQIRRLGCSKQQYDDLMRKQNGGCAICGATVGHHTKAGAAKLAVDHDHKTGKIRGLLCGTCNKGLGCIGEENLQSALEYVANASGE